MYHIIQISICIYIIDLSTEYILIFFTRHVANMAFCELRIGIRCVQMQTDTAAYRHPKATKIRNQSHNVWRMTRHNEALTHNTFSNK